MRFVQVARLGVGHQLERGIEGLVSDAGPLEHRFEADELLRARDRGFCA
jgi:hypothetical protein